MSSEEVEPLIPDSEQDVEATRTLATIPQRQNPQGDEDDTATAEALRVRMAKLPKRPIKRDPIFIIVPYAISFLVSFAGFCVGIAGYVITLYGPFDEQSRARHRKGYEDIFILNQGILFFLGFNCVWTLFNLVHAYRGCQENLWFANYIYDFLIWALLIAFPVLNMVELLYDRDSMCEFRTPEGKPIYEYNKNCEEWTLALLVVEMVSINLGILVAVIHFGLMIGRCCTHSNIKMKIRERIAEEEGYLVELMDRRRRLEQDLGLGETSPSLPVDTHRSSENTSQPLGEDLIDIGPEAPGRPSESSQFTPYASADGSEAPQTRIPVAT